MGGLWRFCRFIRIWDWKTEYSPADLDLVFRDGIAWSLDIAYDDSCRIQTSGFNVYPSFDHHDQSSVTMDRFGMMLNFVDNMVSPPQSGAATYYAEED